SWQAGRFKKSPGPPIHVLSRLSRGLGRGFSPNGLNWVPGSLAPIEKTADGQTKVCHTRKAQAEACVTGFTARGLAAHPGRPQKTIVCPTGGDSAGLKRRVSRTRCKPASGAGRNHSHKVVKAITKHYIPCATFVLVSGF